MNIGKTSILVLIIFIISLGVVSAETFDFIEDSSQSQSLDGISEDIGGDGILKLNIPYCSVLDEKNIPDGTFADLNGDNFIWKNAKNISFSDEMGFDSYVIVWKTSPEDYNLNSSDKDLFISGYTPRYQDIYFLQYSKTKNMVYGVILGNHNQLYSQSDLVYDMLGFNESQLDVSSDVTGNLLSSGSSSSASSGSSHYGGVETSPYHLAKNDPGAYYDHYEYGDNYEIDDYLESQGFD